MSFWGTTWPSSLTSSFLLCGSTEITLNILCFRPTKPITFHLQGSSPQLQLLINPRPTLIHQNHIICKEHILRNTTLYVSCNIIHHQNKYIRAQSQPLMQSYINWKVISVSVTYSNTCHNIIVHILNESNVLWWDFVLLQSPSQDILMHFVIGCNIPPRLNRINSILIPPSCNFFSGSSSAKNFRVKRAWPEAISGWVTDREVFPGAQSEDKSAQKRLGLVCRARLWS
jgi:hypothetical protein